MTWQSLADVVLAVFALYVMTTDLRSHRIPNHATYPAMLAGLAFAALAEFPGSLGSGGFVDHLAALALAFVVTYPLYAMGGLKAGDVKLLMAVGALEGAGFLFVAAIWGALIGGVIGIVYVAVARVRSGRPLRDIVRTFIPYGVALGLGALVALALKVGR